MFNYSSSNIYDKCQSEIKKKTFEIVRFTKLPAHNCSAKFLYRNITLDLLEIKVSGLYFDISTLLSVVVLFFNTLMTDVLKS